jgi:hypothetical protein
MGLAWLMRGIGRGAVLACKLRTVMGSGVVAAEPLQILSVQHLPYNQYISPII